MRLLILGSKEYPLGTNRGDDARPSGGMEAYAQELAPRLAAHGIKPVVVTRQFRGARAAETRDGVEIHRVPWVPGFFLRNPSFTFFAFLRALGLAYDAVLAQGFFATLTAEKLRWLRGGPVVARPAGIAWTQPQYGPLLQRAIRLLERFAYAHADAVVFLSEGEKQQFARKLGFSPRFSAVIPTGVDVRRFQAGAAKARGRELRKRLGWERAFVVVFVGRLIEVKGLPFLLRALRGTRVRALVVGQGPLQARLEDEARREGVEDRVRFVGGRARVEDYLHAGDAFALPSLSEGLPVALLEALAAGKPCVVTDIGLPVADGKTALVVPPANADALRAALQRLERDGGLRRRLGAAGLRLAKSFSWEKTARGYAELLRALGVRGGTRRG